MQQKENFLKTKRGKIIVGSVGSVVGLLLLILTICFFVEKWPFNVSINEKDLNTFQTAIEDELKDEKVKDTGADNNKIVNTVKDKIVNFENKVEKFNKKRNDDKKINANKIKALKDKITGDDFKDKDKTAFKEAITKTKFKTDLEAFVNDAKEQIKK
uniref:Immunodominant membrane protein n=1 Tax=Elm yellows phytoplasma TaxID=35774 RepID=A0A7U0TEE0_ELYEP|nr:immunodominant membrane protein [Candidatus Phytoplasma ulmi]